MELEDPCGNIASDTIHLELTDGCVWPGDVNSDGIVDMVDFLALGIANQETGQTRPHARPDWMGQLAPNWSRGFESNNPLAPDVDFKHADCDGNGVIDLQADAEVLVNNLGFHHSLEGLPVKEGPSFRLAHVQTSFSKGGDTAAIEIALYLFGPNNSDVQNFYGMAFGLNFSSPIVQAPEIVPSSEWMEPMESLSIFGDGSQQAFGSQFFPRDRKSLSVGFVSANRRSSFGRGLAGGGIIIVTVEDIVEDSLRNGLSNFSISSENVMIIDSSGNPLSMQVGKSLDVLDIELDWQEGAIGVSEGLSGTQGALGFVSFEAYPNPFREELYISYDPNLHNMSTIRVLNSLGQKVWQQREFYGQSLYKLNTRSWPSGIYFVSLEAEGKHQVFKVYKR